MRRLVARSFGSCCCTLPSNLLSNDATDGDETGRVVSI